MSVQHDAYFEVVQQGSSKNLDDNGAGTRNRDVAILDFVGNRARLASNNDALVFSHLLVRIE